MISINREAPGRFDFEILERTSTPTVANAIELFDIRPRDTGFVFPGLQCLSPLNKPIYGFAVTCQISSAAPGSLGSRESFDYWESIEAVDGPRIAAVQDLDAQPAAGSFWGEVNASIHLALQCRGTVTNGAVRDADEMRAIGFQALYRSLCVSHAYVHIVDFAKPVVIHGTVIRPGELLHIDQHGCLMVPHEVLGDLEKAIAEVERREKPVLAYARSGKATRAGLAEIVKQHLRNHPKWIPGQTC